MSTPSFKVFDIESRPDPKMAELLFKPSSRIKDPAKIDAAKADAIADASLNPITGSIIIIGMMDDEGKPWYLEGPERKILDNFWTEFESPTNAYTKFCFWSGCGAAGKMFDIDFIVTRSRILGVRVPSSVRNGRFYSSRIVDLASEFLLYQNDAYLSLTNAAEAFRFYDIYPELTRKKDTDLVRGENFWEYYEKDKHMAMPYLLNDLNHVYRLAQYIL